MSIDKEIINQLHAALKAASDHLDYCGYGDNWERECARASGIEKQIEDALALLPPPKAKIGKKS